MTTLETQREILRLKKQTDTAILAHTYVRHEVTEIADFTGDSYALALRAKEIGAKNVILCGVRFMGETAKILSPQKKVLIPDGNAGCPMAEQLSVSELRKLKARYPGAATVAYVNTTAALKAECDVAVTSSSAERILSAMPEKEILFVPDCHLGEYVAARLPEKTFHFFNGGCPVHTKAKREDVELAKKAHPDALFLAHPECLHEVVALADYVGSTSGIMSFAKKSDKQEFIIGTENAVVEHLQAECPRKKFYPLQKHLLCADMKLVTLQSVLACFSGGGEEIVLDEPLRLAAKRCLDKMIAYGG